MGGKGRRRKEGRKKATNSVHETSSDGSGDRTENEERPVATELGDEATRNDDRKDDGKHEGEDVNPGLGRVVVANGLVQNRDIIGEDKEGATSEEGGGEDSPDGFSLGKDRDGDHGLVTEVALPEDEDDGQDAGDDEAGDDAILPGLLVATPLEGEDEGSHGAEDEDAAEPVEVESLTEDGAG
jgi:hypothetical protein